MGLSRYQSIFDPTELGDTVGSYLLASDGTPITHTGGAIDVNIASGADFDIRDLDSAQDNIEIQTAAGQALDIDASGYLTVNGNGDFNVTATDLDIRDLTSASDSVEIKTAAGQALDIEADGSINVNSKQAGFSSCAYAAKSVTNTATQLFASALASRKSVLMQNRGSKSAYVGCDASVTTANGIEVPRGASVELFFDDTVDLHAITASGTADFRLMEAA